MHQYRILNFVHTFINNRDKLPDIFVSYFVENRYIHYYDHRLRGSGSTVVTMTSKVNGTMEISTPCRSEIPENIETKIGHNDYVVGPFHPANFRRSRSKWVRSPYS